MLRAAQRVLLIFAAASASGCYSYHAADLADLQPGQPVRVRVTRTEAERLEPILLAEQRLVEGVVVQRASDELLLDTRVRTPDRQRTGRMLTQRLNIALAEIQDVELRRRDRLKSAAAIGVVGVAVAVGVAAAFGGGRGSRPGEGDPVVELRPAYPRFQLHLRW